VHRILQCMLAGVAFWYPATMTAASAVANAVKSSRNEDRLLEEDENIFVSHFSVNGTIRQLHALYCFYLSTGMNSTHDDGDSADNNWFRDDPETVAAEADVEMSYHCNFTGVGCDKQGHVTSLELCDFGLTGYIPECIADLDQLRFLILKGNSLTGPIPNSLAHLVHLSTLNLADNSLSGPLTDIWSSLTSLRRLRLDRNTFEGTMPESFCHLSALVALDLSVNERLTGSLPACLATLTHLESLRVTDIGLTETIPPDLCSSDRAMNGFSPNTLGCSVIGCPAGTFREGNGRRTSADAVCMPCEVPSNVIASTQCHWVNDSLFDQEDDSRQPSWTPTILPLLYSPTKSPTGIGLAPSPVVTRWGEPSPSPSPLPTESALSDPNDNDSLVVDGIVAGSNVDIGGSSNATPGILGGTLTAGTFLIILMAFLVWRRRSRYKELTSPVDSSDKESHSSDPEVEDIPTLPHQSLSTIEEENNSEVVVVGSGSTASIPQSPTVSSDPPSPPALRQVGTGTGRRVRFSLPDLPIPWSSGDSDESGPNETAQQSQHQRHRQHEQVPYNMNSIPRQQDSARNNDAEAWASWILYPLFDTPGLCAMPGGAQQASHDDDEDLGSAAPSHHSATMPVLPPPWSSHHRESSASSPTDFYYCFDARQPRSMGMTRSSLRRSGHLLGIEDRITDSEDDGIVLLERGYGGLSTTTSTGTRRETRPSCVPTQLERGIGDSNTGDMDLASTMAVIDEGTYHLADDDDDWATAIGGMSEI
jgi:Leucine rich repeat